MDDVFIFLPISFIAGTLNDTIDEMLVYFPKKNKLEISEWFKQKSYEAKPIPILPPVMIAFYPFKPKSITSSF